MLVIYKVTVAAAGTPGPILGDGVKSTATLLIPTSPGVGLSTPTDSLGAYVSVFNKTAASGRAWLRVARAQIYALQGNTGKAYWGAQGQAAANMVAQDPGTAFPPIGNGEVTDDIDIGQLDVDVATSGGGFLVIMEVG